jgi:hypothetical protein
MQNDYQNQGLLPDGLGIPPRDQSQTLVISHDTNLKKREVYDHDKFDLDCLQPIQGLQEIKGSWKFKMETVVGTWILFNAVTTIMIILTNFQRGVEMKHRQEFGVAAFNALTGFIIYFPLCYFTLVLLIFNNGFSEMSFYMYLKRGAIIDFPMSSNFKQLLTSVLPMLFIVPTLCYAVITIFTMFRFGGSAGAMAIFLNNLAIGVGYSWYRQQSIEWKFVSLSDFIQAFPDREEKYGNMDEQSLHSAARFLEQATLTESGHNSWTGYMRDFYWRQKNFGPKEKLFHHVFSYALVLTLAGISLAYFLVLGRYDIKSIFINELNPCLHSCVDNIQNTSLYGNATACVGCMCRCMHYMQQKGDSYFEHCPDYATSAQCSADQYAFCPSSVKVCEAIMGDVW